MLIIGYQNNYFISEWPLISGKANNRATLFIVVLEDNDTQDIRGSKYKNADYN